jgi:hypothetical protein
MKQSVFSAIAVAALFVEACSGAAADAPSQDSSFDGAMTIDNVAGTLPGGLPQYPNAKPFGRGEMVAAADGKIGEVVSFSTTDGPEMVMDYYARAASGLGIRVIAETGMVGGRALSLLKGRQSIQVLALSAGGRTQVHVSSGSM